MSEDKPEYETIETDVPFAVFDAIMHECVKHPASRVKFDEFRATLNNISDDTDYDLDEAYRLIGEALVNDFFIRAIQAVIMNTETNGEPNK
mgnify:CR=1 FL=1